MAERQAKSCYGAALAGAIRASLFLMGVFSASPDCFADSLAPLTVEQPPQQSLALTQGFSTTIHSERPFGKISITDPDIVDIVLRTDKTAVLVPQRLGRTNIDFLDSHGSLIGRMNVHVVRQGITDRVVIYDRPSLGAYSAFHCGQSGCEHFEEVPDKEQALTPSLAQDRGPIGGGLPPMGVPPLGMPPQ